MPLFGTTKAICFYKIISIQLFICFFSFTNGYSQKSNNQPNSTKSEEIGGPVWITKNLIDDHVFQAPVFQFTNAYDLYRQYPNIKGLFMKGLTYHGNSTEVFCWYGIPETLERGEKAPAVVLVHGGGGTVFPEWVKKWTDRGYIAISIALEGQVPGVKVPESKLELKHPTTESSGPHRKGFFLDLKTEKLADQWFYHAVADIILSNSLLRSFPEVDQNKIGITGISWGGILTNVVTGIDNRFAFAIPVYGCGYLHEAPTYIKQLEAHSPESKKFYLQNWEPSLYVPLQKQPTLFVNGSNDGHFSMNSFTKTYQASTSEKYMHVEYEMKHGHGPGWNVAEIYDFADYVTKGAPKPLKLTCSDYKKNVIEYEGEIDKVFAYYTTKVADWSGDKYKWTETSVLISERIKEISIVLPEDAIYFFVNAISKDGKMYSTPMYQTVPK